MAEREHRDSVEHVLKTWPLQWEDVADGRKTFEWRKDDRDFRVGDTLVLRKWNPLTREFAGIYDTANGCTFLDLRMMVTYILRGDTVGQVFGVPEGYCVMALTKEATDG